MSSWESSACYPRRTFYPLSDGPSTRDHRITMTDFRLCSTRQSRSQAGLCHCTLADGFQPRSEEHTSELQSLMRISYAVFCLKKKKNNKKTIINTQYTDLNSTINSKNRE